MRKSVIVFLGLIGALISADIQARELSLKEAIQLSIQNQPRVQAIYQESGITEAEIRAESALQNPVISGAFLSGSEANKTEWGVEQDISKWLFALSKGKSFDAQLQKTRYLIAKEVSQQAYRTKVAFYTLQADLEMNVLRKQLLDSEAAALELAQKQFEAGNTSTLDLSTQKSAYADRQLDFEKSLAQLQRDHIQLQKELGMSLSDLEITETMPEVPSSDFALGALEKKASQNLDLAVLNAQLDQIKEGRFSAGLAESFQSVSVGMRQEREGSDKTGPTVQVALPLWNQGQVSAQKQEAEIKKWEFERKAKEQELLTEIRADYQQLSSLKKQIVLVEDSLIPAKTETLNQTLKQYNYMLKGIYTLLQAKQEELKAKELRITLLKEYWNTLAELELLTASDFLKEASHD